MIENRRIGNLIMIAVLIIVLLFAVPIFQPYSCKEIQVTVIDLQTTYNFDIEFNVFYKNQEGVVSQKVVEDDIFYSLKIGDTAYVSYCVGDWVRLYFEVFEGNERIEQ